MDATFTTGKELQKMDPVFGQLSFDDHEQYFVMTKIQV
jgi:leucine dehydrogenase